VDQMTSVRLLISGSKVRVLVRPPIKSRIYAKLAQPSRGLLIMFLIMCGEGRGTGVGPDASDETVEIFVEADFESLPEERRRFAIINIPRQQYSQAAGGAARRGAKKIG
jgi:hypothetical protein